jgi:hypothetical protein
VRVRGPFLISSSNTAERLTPACCPRCTDMFYGLRVHPEFLPTSNPCLADYDNTARE